MTQSSPMTEHSPAEADRSSERKRLFLELLDPVHDSLARFARAMTHDRDEARDLVGETILIALEQFDSLKDHRAFLGFLFTIAHRTCHRRTRRRRFFGAYDERDAARLHSTTTAPDIAPDIAALHAALEKLPAEQREAVALFELSGLSLEEIREIQGGTLSGVKARVARGRRKLAKLLGVEESAPARSRRTESTSNETSTDQPDSTHTLLYSMVQHNG